jgi:tetratricopeptide (TPR) repeat protein
MAKREGSRPAKLAGARRSPVPEPPFSQPAKASAPAVQPAPVPPASPGLPAEALALFQRGMEALQRHAYSDAVTAFQAVIMGFSGERAMVERARVYLALAEREANRRPSVPRTIEERLTAATAALNNNDDAGAEELARSVLGDEPRHDLALYLLAAIHSRRSDIDEALSLLAKVLALTPEASAQARADDDFDNLRDSEEFWKMTEPPATAPAGLRRPRKPRGER